MIAALFALALIADDYKVPDDAVVLAAVQPRIDALLVAPASAHYTVVRKEGRAAFPSSDQFRGTVNAIDQELTQAGYSTFYGAVDASNRFGVRLRATWVALMHADDLGCVVFLSNNNERYELYQSDEFNRLMLVAIEKCLKDVFRDFAKIVHEVETNTKRLSMSSPKRQTLYWGVLNRHTSALRVTKGISESELDLALRVGIKRQWPTDAPEHLASCELMMRRQVKERKLAIKQMETNMARAAIQADVGRGMAAASATATRHNSFMQGYMESLFTPRRVR